MHRGVLAALGASGSAVLAFLAVTGGLASASPHMPDLDAREARAAGDEEPVCSTANTMAFSGILLYRARHFGGIKCRIPTRVRCRSDLYDLERPAEPISRERSKGSRRCSFDSGPSDAAYLIGHQFEERFSYRITLKEGRVWRPKPTEFCPKVSGDRRTLTCRFTHDTRAPIRATVATG